MTQNLEAVRGALAALQALLDRRAREACDEVSHYPTPIARCDVQLTAAIEQRDHDLDRLRAIRAGDLASLIAGRATPQDEEEAALVARLEAALGAEETRAISLGTRRLVVTTSGHGSPVVVLETGLGAESAEWGAVQRALQQVNGTHLGTVPVGVMSGGELQRIRIAQALAADPVLLLCDEPLLNLDPANARLVSALIDARRRATGTAVLFVTHEVNPVLPYVDRVLYLVDGRFRVGTVEEVMTSAMLSELYRADIQVVEVGGRYVVVGEHLDHSGHASGHEHD